MQNNTQVMTGGWKQSFHDFRRNIQDVSLQRTSRPILISKSNNHELRTTWANCSVWDNYTDWLHYVAPPHGTSRPTIRNSPRPRRDRDETL